MPEKCLICYKSNQCFCQKDEYGRIKIDGSMDKYPDRQFIPISIEECLVYQGLRNQNFLTEEQ